MQVVRKDIMDVFNNVKFCDGKLDGQIDIRIFRSLNNSILRTQINGNDVLYFSGKKIGNEFGRNIKAKNIDDVVSSINDLITMLKLGHIKSSKKIGRNLLLDVKDCPLCDPGKDSRCYLYAGLLAGIVSKILQKDIVGREIDCKNKNRDICTFELKFL